MQLDNTHPLAFGYGDTYSALVRTPLSYQLPRQRRLERGRYQEERLLRRLRGHQGPQGLVDTFVLGEQDLGRGQVIYLGDNPLFRAFWQSGKLLFGNAVFLVGQ
ncbi:MAG: hypothetical protein WKG07_17640 [Hymenobacter sp.]